MELCSDTSIPPIIMKLTSFTKFLPMLFVVLLGAAAANALPVIESRDVWTPPVLYPHAGTVWKVKNHHNVTWGTLDPPVNITNRIGRIMLRAGGLTTPVILADNFDILLGRIEVEVPWVVPGDDYQLVLFGDSGDFSDEFTITN